MYHIPSVPRMQPADVIHPITHCLVPQTFNNNNNPMLSPVSNGVGTVGIDECDKIETMMPTLPPPHPIYAKSIKPSIKAPPYKSPPPYGNGPNSNVNATNPTPTIPSKSVKFADSPVLLRRKVCFEDEVINRQPQQTMSLALSPRRSSIMQSSKDSMPPPAPPPRAEATRLSTHQPLSPKRLIDSQSNPPHDFLKDLQRVMRKKWQVAQKCKLEPATTPHEVLGFRDFNEALAAGEFRDTSHYYRESSNVSNWVQEHYGNATVDSLYENLGADMGIEPIVMKKRPPPPPPKRSNTTQLTNK